MAEIRLGGKLNALQTVTKTFTPEAGKRTIIHYFNMSGNNLRARLVWKHDEPDEEVVWVIGSSHNPMIHRFEIDPSDADGIKKIAVIVDNLSNDEEFGAFIAQIEVR